MPNFHARHLPHYEVIGHPIFLTWRLQGSLPVNRVFSKTLTSGEAFVTMDNILHKARVGPVYLQIRDKAHMISTSLIYRESTLRHCVLHAWVVMPNHVHVLLTPAIAISKLTQSLKRFTALEANRMLGLSGPFWQEETYDRVVRDAGEFRRIYSYIQMNPVKAGLVNEPCAFTWSSANPRWAD